MAYMLAASTLTVRHKDDREMYRPLILLQEEDGAVNYLELRENHLSEAEALIVATGRLRSAMLTVMHSIKLQGFNELNGVRDRDEPV